MYLRNGSYTKQRTNEMARLLMAGRRQKEKTEIMGRMYGNSIQTTDDR